MGGLRDETGGTDHSDRGLGPTKDDVTKKVLAEYFDTGLVMK